jgi:hypothetical protein
MTGEEFRQLFEQALEAAAQNAEAQLGLAIPRCYEIEMHGRLPGPRMLGKDAAFSELYLGPDRFFRIIDVAVRRVSKNETIVFMHVSGHEPGHLNQTWNQPPGMGPFKQLLSDKIEVS